MTTREPLTDAQRRPAVFFDRDNTLIVNDDYLGDAERVLLMPGAADAIARLRGLGFAIVTVSNQSGVARGMYREEDVEAVNRRMDELLLIDNARAVIDRHEFCPDHPLGTVEPYRRESQRRKPSPGMILDATAALGIDLRRSWLIGDAPRDVAAGRAAGCRTILLVETNGPASPAAKEALGVEPDYRAGSLQDAVDFIEMNMDTPAAQPTAPTAPLISLAPTPPAAPAHDEPAETDLDALLQSQNRIETRLTQAIDELRRLHEPSGDFSVARMMAGVLIGFSVMALFAAVLYRAEPATFQALMLVAIFLQVTVSSLLLMGR